MIFYHRTTEENWKKIQQEGILFGIPYNKSYRFTYLSPDDMGESYGNVLLQVEYNPTKEMQGKEHNFGFNPPPGEYCWQFSVFVPIPISQVRRLN